MPGAFQPPAKHPQNSRRTMKLTPTELAKLLDYDPVTGSLTWRVSPNRRIRVGSKAGCVADATGRIVIGIAGEQILAHHAAWALTYGYWPTEIDHEDRDPSHNWLTNLREASHADNAKNKGLSKRNSSGFKGVSFCKKTNRYVAYIGSDHSKKRIGAFTSPQQAAAAYDQQALQLHGQYAVTNKALGLL